MRMRTNGETIKKKKKNCAEKLMYEIFLNRDNVC